MLSELVKRSAIQTVIQAFLDWLTYCHSTSVADIHPALADKIEADFQILLLTLHDVTEWSMLAAISAPEDLVL